jgi:hypothetical protein
VTVAFEIAAFGHGREAEHFEGFGVTARAALGSFKIFEIAAGLLFDAEGFGIDVVVKAGGFATFSGAECEYG